MGKVSEVGVTITSKLWQKWHQIEALYILINFTHIGVKHCTGGQKAPQALRTS